MRLASAFLVVVATPLVVLAALVFVPIGWLAATGLIFVLTGVVVALAARDRNRRSLLGTPDDLIRTGDDSRERSHPVHRASGLGSWMRR